MKLPLQIMRIKRRHSSSIFHARFIVYKFVVVISAYNVKKVSYAEFFIVTVSLNSNNISHSQHGLYKIGKQQQGFAGSNIGT